MVPFFATRYVGTFRVFYANVAISMAQGWWLLAQGWLDIGTFRGLFWLYDNISKIRARYDTRRRRAQPEVATEIQ